MGILQAVLAALNIAGKLIDMFTKAQADKEAEMRVTSKVRKKVENAKDKVKKKLRDRYPEFIDRE